VIAHRLSTVQRADVIYVIDDGKVVEHGSHDELLRLDGTYARIYHSQFELTTELQPGQTQAAPTR
jgi:ABC-type multidrug transport system fused ATPase/permease subunit